jgi:site-specific DNA-methyltransferase (adenine-specific)
VGCADRSVIEHYFGNSQWVFPTKEIYEGILQTTGYFKRPYESLRQEYESLRYTFNNQTVMTSDFNKQCWNNNVWNYEIAPKTWHITPKPVDLIENIIRHSSNEGDTVLDPFMGSGTTGVACINTNRKFIGIELEPEYVEIANRRIQPLLEQTKLGYFG